MIPAIPSVQRIGKFFRIFARFTYRPYTSTFMRILFLLCPFLLAMTFSKQLHAQAKHLQTRWFIEGGAEFGGDEIVEVTFTTGGTQSIYAGQGGSIHAGAQFTHPDFSKFMGRASIGYKYTTTAAENVDLTLTRIPINVTGYYLPDNHFRLGIGLSTHQSIAFDGGGAVGNLTFEPSLGSRLEIGYDFVSVTYTVMKYKVDNGPALNANAVGFAFSWVF
jgi:hypothetical protein